MKFSNLGIYMTNIGTIIVGILCFLLATKISLLINSSFVAYFLCIALSFFCTAYPVFISIYQKLHNKQLPNYTIFFNGTTFGLNLFSLALLIHLTYLTFTTI